MGRLAVAIAIVAGCTKGPAALLGPSTDATCPPGSTLTYASFGSAFMASYCTRCHSSTLSGDARMGAPLLHDFNTLYGIEPFVNHIDETAASGPNATNTLMPFNGSEPSLAEREMLGEWLACGIPP